MSGENEKKENFFNRLKNEEHRAFEITMFAVSVCVALVVLTSVVIVFAYFQKARGERISEEEVNATNVTDAAITVTEEPEGTPFDPVIKGNEEDFDDNEVDEDLKNSKVGYTTATVNLRDKGSLTAAVLMKVPAGSKVKLLGLQDDNEWMEVNYNGTAGYINVMYLTATKPAATATPIPATAAPRTKTPPPATPTPKKTKPPKKTKQPEDDEETDEPEETDAPATQEPTPAPTAVPVTEKPKPTQEPATEKPTDPPTATPDTSSEQQQG